MNDEYIPHVNESRCTGCTACVHMCPSNAISHTEVDCIDIIQQVHELARQGKTGLWATCHAVCDTSANLNVPCHALWDPLLLACIAAEGIQTLRLGGINQCVSCPVRYGAKMMAQTEKDYAVLNKALGTHLKISWDETPIPAGQKQKEVSEPARRTFFRNLFPTMAQGAIMAAARLQQLNDDEDNLSGTAVSARLPLRLRLFLRALPHLQVNFTPVPGIPSLPLGAIQADASCTACGDCVEQCPTEALELKAFGSGSVLEFSPDACIGCWQCVDRCPEHAIEALPAISLPSLLTRHARPLVMVKKRKDDKIATHQSDLY